MEALELLVRAVACLRYGNVGSCIELVRAALELLEARAPVGGDDDDEPYFWENRQCH